MLRGLKRYVVIGLLLYLIVLASVPAAVAEIEIRNMVRYGDTIFNNEIIILPIRRTIFHTETLAAADTEAFSMSPLNRASADGLTLAQTSSSTVAGTQTGFFEVNLPFIWLPEYPGAMIGDSPNWAANVQPIRFAGLRQNQMLVFPSMVEIDRIQDSSGGNFSYATDPKNMVPYLPGNVMLVKNVTDEQGRNKTVLERPPREYMTLIATPEEVANKTIIERMWRNVHLNFNLDRAYVGETAYPTLIYPVPARDTLTLMQMVPDRVSISAALNMTKPGKHMRHILWPVA